MIYTVNVLYHFCKYKKCSWHNYISGIKNVNGGCQNIRRIKRRKIYVTNGTNFPTYIIIRLMQRFSNKGGRNLWFFFLFFFFVWLCASNCAVNQVHIHSFLVSIYSRAALTLDIERERKRDRILRGIAREFPNLQLRDGVEEMLSGCDAGTTGLYYLYGLSCLVMA